MPMKCFCCGEEVGNVSVCPVCGQALVQNCAKVAQMQSVQPVHSGADVFERAANGILEISWSEILYRHSGSGLLLSLSGYALTNAHVVRNDKKQYVTKVKVKIAGETVSASVLCSGECMKGCEPVDLALLMLDSVPSAAAPFEFDDSARVKNGERVYVVGNSLGYGTCITEGIISDKLRDVNGRNLMMTDCAVNHGNSGGPMFNEEGKVIGVIVSVIERAEGMNFAIPSRTVMQFLGACGVLSAIKKNF